MVRIDFMPSEHKVELESLIKFTLLIPIKYSEEPIAD